MEMMRESIFVAAVRGFCVTFAKFLGFLIAFALAIFFFLSFTTPSILPAPSSLTILPDAYGNREILPESDPVILQIKIDGVIGLERLTHDKIEAVLLDSREDMMKNNRVKAIMLYMNTPGGTETDSDGIYRAIKAYKEKYKIPVYAYVDGICASGGMYIASAADKIYSGPTAMIGSVGVIMGPVFNFSQVMDKIGVQSLTLTEGIDKDMLNPFRVWKPGEDKCLRDLIAYSYQQFVGVVTTNRPNLDRDKLINEYGAQVYNPVDAQSYGYIDVGPSDYATALADLATAAGITKEQKYQVICMEPPLSFFSELSGGCSTLFKGKIVHTLDIDPRFSPELSGKLLYLYTPGIE